MKKNKAFTLIELIAVLVILAILATIVTPLVLNIIRKARISADKRSIDAYGRSIEIAIAGYLLDTGKFPTDVNQLFIEYSGDEVVCSTTQLNDDSSVYLTGCTVKGRTVDYAYGKDKSPSTPTYTAYSVGDEVRYNNVDYYVIADSGTNESTVTLLKAEPLTVAEVNTYGGVGTDNNHVNKHSSMNRNGSGDYAYAYDINGYGGMQYFSSNDCSYVYEKYPQTVSGCSTNYNESEVKYVIDEWKNAKAPAASEARLITKQEIEDSFEFLESDEYCGHCGIKKSYISNATWMYNSNYSYWTMSGYNDSNIEVWFVTNDGMIGERGVQHCYAGGSFGYSGSMVSASAGVVRPVIVLPKSALE